MTNLGWLYANGQGVAQDYAKAREWYEKAADKGDASAMPTSACFTPTVNGVAQDYAKAREWYEKAADKGDASAMTNLGVLYDNGQGVAQDYVKAREWYEKAADKGDAGAMRNLGLLYDNGQGVAQDYAKAREWYEKAAENGSAAAMSSLGSALRQRSGRGAGLRQGARVVRKGRRQGRRERHDQPRRCFTTTVNGVAQDYAKAREWYEKAADKGSADAMATSAGCTTTVKAWRRTMPRRASGTKRPLTRATRTRGNGWRDCRSAKRRRPDAILKRCGWRRRWP